MTQFLLFDSHNSLFYSFMARKLYAFALEKCATESADNPMMQEVLLGGHLYLMTLKVICCMRTFLLVWKKSAMKAVCYLQGDIMYQMRSESSVTPVPSALSINCCCSLQR